MILARFITVLVALTFCIAVDWSASVLACHASGNVNSPKTWQAGLAATRRVANSSSQLLSFLINPRNSHINLFPSEDD
ncbi:MAG TPA: hypothetical protein VEF04_03530, partial [Blastocatellia bacterium]|nr:hypothetical protein [Blastocatellia bacterium]